MRPSVYLYDRDFRVCLKRIGMRKKKKDQGMLIKTMKHKYAVNPWLFKINPCSKIYMFLI